MKTDEIGGRELCPCRSGLTYARCCKKRSFKWIRDARGNVAKSISLSDEALEILKRNGQEFRATFGRKYRKNDPVFLERYYASKKDLNRVLLRAMRAAGVAPSVMYASKKTGFIVTEERRNLLSTDEENEWNAAIDEFYDRVAVGDDPEDLIADGTPPEFLREHIYKTAIAHVVASDAQLRRAYESVGRPSSNTPSARRKRELRQRPT